MLFFKKKAEFYRLMLAVFSAFLMGPAFAALIGSTFVVNPTSAGSQEVIAAKAGANGDRVVMWKDMASGGLVFMQRYDAAGTKIHAAPWNVGNGITDVAVGRVGQYVVVSVEQDGAGKSVYGTVYDRNGNVTVNKFKLNGLSNSNIYGARVAINEAGKFAVLWTAGSGSSYAVYARAFSAAGVPVSMESSLSAPSANQFHGDIAIDGAGNYSAVFVSVTTTADVLMRRYSANGVPASAAFIVSTYTASTQAGVMLAMNDEGNSVVVWESYGQDGSGYGIYGQRVNAAGSKIGAEFRVNSTVQGEQQLADVGIMDDGKFSVVWRTDNSAAVPGTLPSIRVRDFSAAAVAVASESVIVSEVAAMLPFIAMDPSGHSLVAWMAADETGQFDVRARLHRHGSVVAVTSLTSGVAKSGLSGEAGTWKYFRIIVPSGATSLTYTLTGTGEADIYGRLAAVPLTTDYEFFSANPGSGEGIIISTPPAGAFIIGVYGYGAYSGVSLKATVQ
ncbi:MAG: hypothetical protein Q8J78_10955 [Moraxellaceae bacterium]|nr:hypothetical protein [Moraxellaceae bacterium]